MAEALHYTKSLQESEVEEEELLTEMSYLRYNFHYKYYILLQE